MTKQKIAVAVKEQTEDEAYAALAEQSKVLTDDEFSKRNLPAIFQESQR